MFLKASAHRVPKNGGSRVLVPQMRTRSLLEVSALPQGPAKWKFHGQSENPRTTGPGARLSAGRKGSPASCDKHGR